jgi:methyl-accepting chemotaxis protein
MAKPFIAARVPQKIEDKLIERVQETGLGKTEIIVNALAQYLGCSIDVPEETRAVDRLVAVEKELAELQNRVRALEKPTEKTPSPEIEGQRVLSFETLSIDNTIDNQTKNTETMAKIVEEVSDTQTDNSLLTHKQMAALSEIKYETVKGRYRKGLVIEWQGKQYNPVKDGKSPRWQTNIKALSK